MNAYFIKYTFPDGDFGYLREFLFGAVRYTHDIEEARTFKTARAALSYLERQDRYGRYSPAFKKRFKICNMEDELVAAFAGEAV
jgi:hypothetical protein